MMESQPRLIREKRGDPPFNVLSNLPDSEGKNAATNLGSSENPPCLSTEPDSVVKHNHANRRGKRQKSPSKVTQKQPTQQGNIPQGSSFVEASKTTAPRKSFTHLLSSVLGSYVTPSQHTGKGIPYLFGWRMQFLLFMRMQMQYNTKMVKSISVSPTSFLCVLLSDKHVLPALILPIDRNTKVVRMKELIRMQRDQD